MLVSFVDEKIMTIIGVYMSIIATKLKRCEDCSVIDAIQESDYSMMIQT